jgi:hypothetical protein
VRYCIVDGPTRSARDPQGDCAHATGAVRRLERDGSNEMIGSIEIDRLEIREILADHPGHVRDEVMHGESPPAVGIRVSRRC